MERKTVLLWLGVYLLLAIILTVEVYEMSATWDDTISDDDKATHTWANDIIAAIKRSRGAKYVVTDDDYGDYICDGTADDVQIQQGIAALTAGRTYWEKVLLRGSFTLADTVTLPDYTMLEIWGKVTLGNNVNKIMFENADTVGGNSYIGIMGGQINGNKGNQSANVQNIHFQNCDHIKVLNTHCYDSYHDSIYYQLSTEGIIHGNIVAGGGDDGINVNDCHRIVVSDNIVRGQTNDGIHFGQNSKECSVIGNQIEDNGGHGILLLTNSNQNSVQGNTLTNDHIGIDNSHRNSIIGNIVNGGTELIYIKNAGSMNILTGNLGTGLTNWGIEIDGSSDNIVEGNFVRNVTNYDGIRLTGNCDNNLINGNYVTGCNGVGRYAVSISAATAQNNILTDNILKNNTAGIDDNGSNTITDYMPQSTASLDLSGGATDIEIWHAHHSCYLIGYVVYYTEASGVGNCNIRIGRYQDGVALDDDYFDLVASEQSKSKGYSKSYITSDLTQTDITVGDTITVGCAGGSGAAGEVRIVLKIANC